jgi:hypothetical protein
MYKERNQTLSRGVIIYHLCMKERHKKVFKMCTYFDSHPGKKSGSVQINQSMHKLGLTHRVPVLNNL